VFYKEEGMLQLRRYLILSVILLSIYPVSSFAQIVLDKNIDRKNGFNNKSISTGRENLKPVLSITPREIDLGTIGPGESVSGVFTFKNMGYGIMGWSTYGPEGWNIIENQLLSGTIEDDADYLHVEIRGPANEPGANAARYRIASYPVQIKLGAGSHNVVCQKDLTAGAYKEAIKIVSAGGLRTIFVTFKIVAAQDLAQIILNPVRMDLGSAIPGKIISRKVRLTNKGKEPLKWSIVGQKQRRTEIPMDFLKRGKYISFANEETRGSGVYAPPAQLKELLDISGKWSEADGYPSSNGGGRSAKFRFNGTGISLYFTTYPDFGNLTIYLDDRLMNEHDWFSDRKEKSELLVAENLADAPHVLTLINKDGHLDIEGIRIMGRELMRGPAGWMTIFPDSGSTTVETEYINVSLNTAQMVPGPYGDYITFNSNGGEGIVEVFLEVVPDKVTKTIDVFRFSKGMDFLFTSNPQSETQRISQNGYVKEGIAFRLFVMNMPGTTSFYRWYNPQKKDHFYHYDSRGGGKQIQGYIFEGSIGNIATSKMANTRELYRWFNPDTSHYFYTTDPKGEAAAKKKYRFDGIAGYVR
jgi:hypothetical protein